MKEQSIGIRPTNGLASWSEPEIKPASISRVDKPWGYEIRWAITKGYLGKVLHINAGHSLSLQYHVIKDECQYVTKGKVEIEIGGPVGGLKTYYMVAGETIHMVAGTRHRITAIEETDIFEVSTPEIDDVVRLADRYGRV